MYLDQYSYKDRGIEHKGNCFTQTLIEHFLLYGIHLKNNSINIAGYYEDIRNSYDILRFSDQYILTDKSLFKKLSQEKSRIKGTEWSYTGVMHWATKIYNDITVLDGIKINKIKPKSIRVFKVGTKYFRVRPASRYKSYVPFSIFDDKWNYFRALSFPVIDSMIMFLDNNREKIETPLALRNSFTRKFNYIIEEYTSI
jgi:hypothetical protein